MMILAHLVNDSIDWRQARVHIKMVINDTSAVESTYSNMAKMLEEIRIDAEIDIIPMENKKFDDILIENSFDADLIFLGLAKPSKNFLEYYDAVQLRIKELPTTILALAAQEVSFGEILIKQEASQDN